MPRRFVAKVFRTGGSQAIRLPKECRMSGEEVAVIQDGGRLILEPINARGWSQSFLEMISSPAPEDLLPPREQPALQTRDEL